LSYIADRLRALAAQNKAPQATAPVGSFFGVPVKTSEDFVRVSALPRRKAEIRQSQIDALHAEVLLDGATRRLRPIQALALLEARERNGLFAPIGVGAGKTDISLLLPTVMRSKVAVLLVPAALRSKVLKQDYPMLVQQYRLPKLVGAAVEPIRPDGVLYVFSYSELSIAKNSDLLERLQPDLIICDEAHALRHPSAARTRRFVRYFKANRSTRLAALSGTITSKSLKDYAHLAFLALKEHTPTPVKWTALEEWSAALDVSPVQAPPGVLMKWCEIGESARDGFRRRMTESPGVIATNESAFLGASLNFYERPVKISKALKDALREMSSTWVRPDGGEEFEDPMTYARYARQLAAGFYYRWTWPRGEAESVRIAWVQAKRAYARAVARFLQHRAAPGLDSPLLVANAAAEGRIVMPEYAAWVAVRDTAEPDVEAVWLDRAVLEDAAKWATEQVGIVWYEHREVGAELAAMTGLPHYGAGADGILKERGDRSIIASIRAHGTGKNLQCFSRNLLVTPPTSGTVWEQLLGRTHRPGQDADEVEVCLYRHTPEMKSALNKALMDAQYQQATTGNSQKLLSATFAWEDPC
jgi:hypothetical protein